MATMVTGEVVSVKYGRDNRSVTTEFATSEPNVVLAVSTFHMVGGVYRSSAMGVRHMPGERGFSITKCSPMDNVSLGREEQGARFSRKALDAVHAQVVKSTRVLMEDGSQTFASVLAATPGERD